MSAGTGRTAAGASEIEFAPALPGDAKIEPGIGYLQPGGLIVHTGWSHSSPPASKDQVLSQHDAYEGTQSWKISTPDGHPAARFIGYLTYERAEQAAAAIAAALPGKAWPARASGEGPLRQLALDASSTPAMLPLTRGGKPDWGWGCQWINWTMPDTRAQYEQMIAAHGVSPANCRTCAGIKKRWGRTVWLPRTGHWPRWNPSVHRRGRECRAHCMCMACISPPAIGTIGTVVDDNGQTVPGVRSAYTSTPIRDADHQEVPSEERPFAWFTQLLEEGGCVILDNRPCEGLWPIGVRHDDAFFCETGLDPDLDS
ncbi:hypothetical protein [Streptomyces mirabilis]|uniref:hypothetical protein n=1 Tax=Streptomyces mirabilis TaxID=68239 RepID=UPI00367D503C